MQSIPAMQSIPESERWLEKLRAVRFYANEYKLWEMFGCRILWEEPGCFGWIIPMMSVSLSADVGALQPDYRETDCVFFLFILYQPFQRLRHHVRLIVVSGIGEQGDLLDERLRPGSVSIHIPATAARADFWVAATRCAAGP